MLKYAKVIDEETKEVMVGEDTNADYYISLGMAEQEVEKAYNGYWYLKGHTPKKPKEVLAKEKRKERDEMLKETDVYMLPDFPITAEEKEQYKLYRQYLRDLPKDDKFPDIEILTFEQWTAQNEPI